jgi:hypothetical protein
MTETTRLSQPALRTAEDPMILKAGLRATLVSAGIYLARVTEIKVEEFYKRKTFVFLFEIADGPYRGVVNGNYKSFSEYTKLHQLYSKVVHGDLNPGDEIDLRAFYGKVFRVRVGNKASKKTKTQFSNVSEIIDIVMDGLP